MRILSCNIRKSDADDGLNGWEYRKDICIKILRERNPDILCFQEMRCNQYNHIKNAFPDHDTFGMTKTATCNHPINAIFYRKDRFERISAGGYWLSETPHIAGSKSWDSASIRLSNWLRLKEKCSDREFRIMNTHIDHISEPAKEGQVALLLEDSCSFSDDYPQILTGDFNMDITHTLIDQIQEAGWWDTYNNIHLPVDSGNTYHGFKGSGYDTDQGRIDWIFARGVIFALDADIIQDNVDGRYPSDHYFVQANISLNNQNI